MSLREITRILFMNKNSEHILPSFKPNFDTRNCQQEISPASIGGISTSHAPLLVR
jgi:hypothetical protein